jgi:pyruvate-ferredoxin/flavodoxin oxidoreductase
MTIADWAASESRFAPHFSRRDSSSAVEEMVPFHEYLGLSKEEREGKVPFVYTLDKKKRLGRLVASDEIVGLAEERLSLWSDLKEMAGLELSGQARRAALASVEQGYEKRIAALRAEYESRLTQSQAAAAQQVVDRILHGALGEEHPDAEPNPNEGDKEGKVS